MFKREVKKWENKFKLWGALHPNEKLCSCNNCPHNKIFPRKCPKKVLTIIGSPTTHRGNYKIVEMRYSQAKEKCHNGEGVIGCAEWIKSV